MMFFSCRCPQCGHNEAYSSIHDLTKLKSITCPVCGIEVPIFKEVWKNK